MVQITTSSGLLGEIKSQLEPTSRVDEQGNYLGLFVPAGAYLPVQLTSEELDRREAEVGGRSLKDIFADLDKQYGT